MPKKAVVTSHLFCRVHLCCDLFSCFVLHDAWEKSISLFIIPYSFSPPELHVLISLWSQGQIHYIVIVCNSSLAVQVQEYNKYNKNPTIHFFQHQTWESWISSGTELSQTHQPPKQKTANSLGPSGQTDLFRARAPEPHGACAAAPGRRRFWPPGGCHRGRWCRRLDDRRWMPRESLPQGSEAERKIREKNASKMIFIYIYIYIICLYIDHI